MKKINFSTISQTYPVFIGNKILSQLSLILNELNSDKILFIVDKKVWKLYKTEISYLINNINKKAFRIIFTASETNKSYNSVQKIDSFLLKHKFGRDAIIVAVGGGITGDVSGFVAATYMRGILYFNVPTTLLSVVDSSIGGKTGINFAEVKNSIGAFYQPSAVISDLEFLKTLSNNDIICGLGEIVKYAFLSDEEFFRLLNRNIKKVFSLDAEIIEELVYKSVKFKSGVVQEDEKENGIRKILNFGHTFAHAIEIEQSHKIKHGEAVIVGISCALHLSFQLGFLQPGLFEKYIALIKLFSSKINIKHVNSESAYLIMSSDKKNRKGKIKFILLQKIGVILVDIEASKNDVLSAFKKGISIFND